jgi:hypothetical protein
VRFLESVSLLEKDETERRIWRDPPPRGFTLKVGPENTASQYLAAALGVVLKVVPKKTIKQQRELPSYCDA